jgi:phosphomevalonate kinase
MLKQETKYQVSVLNALGQSVLNSELTGVQGKQQIKIKTSQLPQGYYMILVNTEYGIQFEEKFMKK